MKYEVRSTTAALVITLVALIGPPAVAQTTVKDHVEAMKHLRLGQENLRAEKWDLAEREFKETVKLEPALELGHYGLGQVYMATKRYPAAVDAYLACRVAYNSNVAARASDDILAQRRLDDQIRTLEDERAVIGGQRVNATNNNASADLDRRIADLKSQRFHDIKGAPPVPAWISVALGSAYFRSGAMADAEREYRAALDVDPKLGEAHNNLAVVYMLTKRFDEADAEIKAAEKSGFKVNPQLKEDLKKAAGRR
jgi:Tfp pilus assembly protein PilF